MTILLILAIVVFAGDIILQRLIRRRLSSVTLAVRWSDGSKCSFTGLQILQQNLPPGVTLDENTHPMSHGATYYAQRHTVVVARRDFNARDFDTMWRACHELRHPEQTTPLWRFLQGLKIAGEVLYSISLAASVSRFWLPPMLFRDIALGVFGMAALSYFIGDTMPEWDAVLSTPLIWRRCGLSLPNNPEEFEQMQAAQWSHLFFYVFTHDLCGSHCFDRDSDFHCLGT